VTLADFSKFGFKGVLPLGGGEYGGVVVHNSTKNPGKIQVTRFLEDGTPRGDDQYGSVEEALSEWENFQHIDHPLVNQLRNSHDAVHRAWEEATFEHPYRKEMSALRYQYVSILRPLSGVGVDGMTSADKSGRIGVLYRDAPVPLDQMEHLDLIPYSMEARRDFVTQWVARRAHFVHAARRGPGTTVSKPQDLNDALKIKAPDGFHTREDGSLEIAPVLQTGEGIDDLAKLGGIQRYRMTLPNLINRDWSSRPYYVEDWFASPARLGRRLGGTTVQATPSTIMVDFDDLHTLRLAHHALREECRMDPRDITVKVARVGFSTLYKQAQKVQGLRWRIFGDMEFPNADDADKAIEAVSVPVQWDGATVTDLTIDPTEDGAYEFSCVVAVGQEIDGDAAVKVAAKALEQVLREAGVEFDKISAVKSLAFGAKGASMEKNADLKLLFGDKVERPTKLRDARDADIFNPDFEPFQFEDMTVRPERRRDLRVDPRQRQELQRGGWGPGGRGTIGPAFDQVTNVNGGYGRADEIVEELEDMEPLRQELKQRAMIYQREDKEAAARWNGLAEDAYYHIPFVEWEPIRAKYMQEWRDSKKAEWDAADPWGKNGKLEGVMDKQGAMFTEIEDGPHGQTVRTDNPKIDAYKFLAHWVRDGRHYQLVVNEDGSYTCNVDGVQPMTFAPMTDKRASLNKHGADEPDLIYDDSDIEYTDPDTGEERSQEEMADDAAFLWDDFVSGLSALIARVSPSGQWHATGRNMGWRKQSGEHSFMLRDPADANEFLRHILPKTQEFTIKVWDGGNVLEMVVSHHDAPTGEGYTLYPVTIESKLTDEIDRLNQHRTRYQASIGADPDVIEVLFLELDPHNKTFFTFEDNGDEGVVCTLVESNVQDPEFVASIKQAIEGDVFRYPGDFETALDHAYDDSTEEIPENEAPVGVTASLRKQGAVELQPWVYQKGYGGTDFTGYLMGPGIHRDSDAWEKSNFDNALEMLGGEGSGEVQDPDNPDEPLPAVVVEHSGHFAVGWVENILVHQDADDKVAILQDIMDRLEEYPLLNEDDVSSREYDEMVQAFGDYGASDFRKEMNMDEFFDDEFLLLKPDTQMKIHDAFEQAWMESSQHGGHEIHTLYDEAERKFIKLLHQDQIDFISLDDGTPVGVWGESDVDQLTQDYGDDLDLSHPPQYQHPGQMELPFDQTAQESNMDKMSVKRVVAQVFRKQGVNRGPRTVRSTSFEPGEVQFQHDDDESLWMRLGDAGEYEAFSDLADAADMLSELSEGQAFEPQDIRWHGDGMGLSLPGFEGQNYISLFWGDADAQPTRGLSNDEQIEFEDAVRQQEF
jgi:hypothetical protein